MKSLILLVIGFQSGINSVIDRLEKIELLSLDPRRDFRGSSILCRRESFGEWKLEA
jgi:hypothetical protein